MKKIKSAKPSQEELYKSNLESSIRDLRNLYVKNPPTVLFEVGERVKIGALDSTIISEVLDDGQIYIVDVIRKTRDGVSEYKAAWSWTSIEKYREDFKDEEIIHDRNGLFLNYSQREVYSIISKYYHFGIEMNPEYQRDLVWSEQDKVNLIASVFNGIDIGKFLFVHLEWSDREDHKGYEVIDGKQRISALVEFFENRFPYKGKYYKDLHPHDKNWFTGYSISYAEVKGITQKQKYEYFLKVNTCGRIVSQDHLDKVQKLLDECE